MTSFYLTYLFIGTRVKVSPLLVLTKGAVTSSEIRDHIKVIVAPRIHRIAISFIRADLIQIRRECSDSPAWPSHGYISQVTHWCCSDFKHNWKRIPQNHHLRDSGIQQECTTCILETPKWICWLKHFHHFLIFQFKYYGEFARFPYVQIVPQHWGYD